MTPLEHPYTRLLEHFLQTELPITTPLFQLHCLEKEEGTLLWEEEGQIFGIFQLVYFEIEDGQSNLLDIFQQQIFLEVLDGEGEERAWQIFKAWKQAILILFEQGPAETSFFPSDFFYFSTVAKLQRPQTENDFVEAFLRKSRLGRWLL